MNVTKAILRYFNVRKNGHDEIIVSCPYHFDSKPSASININKGLFNCFAGCGGKSFEQIYNDLIIKQDIKMTEQFSLNLGNLLTQQTGKSYLIKKDISENECLSFLFNFLTFKGINISTMAEVNAEPILQKDNNLYGYIRFPVDNNGSYVARKFLPEDILGGERYLNSQGHKPLYGNITEEGNNYILVEGIFDYLSLYQLGFKNVIANLGTNFDARRAYPFKGKVVNILFDNDYAGYTGAQKAFNALRSINAYPAILDLPSKFGKDVNDAINKNKDKFIKWLNECTAEVAIEDTDYIETFDSLDNMMVYPCGIPFLDRILKGGFKIGMHAIAAEPGVGKSALALYLTHNIVLLNPHINALYLTYEIPKQQCWARIASIYDDKSWADIESNPTIISQETKEQLRQLSGRLRIAAGWNMTEIMRVASKYNWIVVDYLQTMPGNNLDNKITVASNAAELSRLALTGNKVIILISSIPRVAYGKEDLSIFKESGDIEFRIQSGYLLSDINKGGTERLLKLVVLKNTRGPVGGNFWLKGDMTHNKFEEIEDKVFIGDN